MCLHSKNCSCHDSKRVLVFVGHYKSDCESFVERKLIRSLNRTTLFE